MFIAYLKGTWGHNCQSLHHGPHSTFQVSFREVDHPTAHSSRTVAKASKVAYNTLFSVLVKPILRPSIKTSLKLLGHFHWAEKHMWSFLGIMSNRDHTPVSLQSFLCINLQTHLKRKHRTFCSYRGFCFTDLRCQLSENYMFVTTKFLAKYISQVY